jgi:tRNA G18 (ribose-2'-O)-methylase SpoU
MSRQPVTVILEDIRSALNVGAIFRTCDAVNAEKLVLTGITPYPPHNRIPKTALGAIETVPWSFNKDKQEVIDSYAKNNTLFAVEITPNARELYNFSFPKNCALIFGNEISGVSDYALQKAAAVIKIPMLGTKESLNIATSVGIVCYEIIRQWLYNPSCNA